MFVADFIGAPPMSYPQAPGRRTARRPQHHHRWRAVEIPEVLEDRAEGQFALGVRPENVSFADASRLRGRVIGAEYLGTTQIVTIDTANGRIKARLPSAKSVQVGETVGLALQPERISLFDQSSGQALHSALYEGGHGG